MAEASHAVFLSYASQDAEAAQKIAEALRAGGIEVFLDQSELRGGDAWDQKIRKQIKTCALFIPVISHATHDRREGYFRLEWKLAVDRSHLMDAELAFLLPVNLHGNLRFAFDYVKICNQEPLIVDNEARSQPAWSADLNHCLAEHIDQVAHIADRSGFR